MTTITQISEAFDLLYRNILDYDFRKTLGMQDWSERDLLPSVRTFLLGRFGEVSPEIRAKLPGKKYGRIDFCVGGVAVEFALRRPYDGRDKISDRVNTDEIKKLLLYRGRALLVLFDYSHSPLDRQGLSRFRDRPSLGRGNHAMSAFNVSYHSRGFGRSHEPDHQLLRIYPR